jgi:uncharacterized protein YaaN involved in tellurite resistance
MTNSKSNGAEESQIEDAQIISETYNSEEIMDNQNTNGRIYPESKPQSEPINKLDVKVNNTAVSLNKQGKIDTSNMSEQQLAKYKQVAAGLETTDNNSILNYGVELQNKLAGYSDAFLNNVRAYDAGEIGNSITDLLSEVNYIDIDPAATSPIKKFLMQIPGVKKLVHSTKKVFQKYDSVSGNIDGIVKKLDQGRLTIFRDNNQLQNLFEQNLEYIGQLDELIIAGKIKLEELESDLINMETNPQNFEDYEISDKRDFTNRLSKRINDMELTRMITIQSIPQIRLVQNNNSVMVEKIQSAITTTIPIWKNSISIAVSLQRQQANLQVQNAIYETTNTILQKNSQMLKTNSIEVAKQNERGVVDINVLRQVNQDLVATLNEIKTIKEQGEQTRKQVSKELESIENDLKKNVMQLNTAGQTEYAKLSSGSSGPRP